MTEVNPPVKFKISPRIMAASVGLKGPYSDWGKGLMRLKAWMDGKRILAVGRPLALLYDNPTETPSAELRSEACFGVSKPFESEGTFSFKEFQECHVAETRHEGPPEMYTRTMGLSSNAS